MLADERGVILARERARERQRRAVTRELAGLEQIEHETRKQLFGQHAMSL